MPAQARRKKTFPSDKPSIYLLNIRYWYWKGKWKKKHKGESWAVSVWDTPEDLQAYGKRTINRLTAKHKIKQGKGPFITDVEVVCAAGTSQLSLAQHRDQNERNHIREHP